jgi:RimJ/RimL family protein N-acetyltransferase
VVGYGGFSNIERGRDALCFIYSQRANPGTLYFARLAIAFAFKEFNLQRVTTTCPAINRAASIFNRKIGFKLEGEHRASWLHEGFLYSTYLFGLLREEAEKWDLKL